MDYAVIELLKGEKFSLMNERISALANHDRNNERRQSERRNEAGLTKREQKYNDNLNAVKKLLEQGLKQKEIVIQIGMSKSRVSELVKIIKEKN